MIWKDWVNKKINDTVKIRTEPKINAKMIGNVNEDFFIRAEVMDKFLDLRDLILNVKPDLEAPPARNIRDFIMSARLEVLKPYAPRKLVEMYCKLYLHARHDPEIFTASDYELFIGYHTKLLAMARFSNQDSMVSDFASINHPDRIHPNLITKFANKNDKSVARKQAAYSLDQTTLAIHTEEFFPVKEKHNSNSLKSLFVPVSVINECTSTPLIQQSQNILLSETANTQQSTYNSYLFNDSAQIQSSIVHRFPTRTGSVSSDDSQTALICLDASKAALH